MIRRFRVWLLARWFRKNWQVEPGFAMACAELRMQRLESLRRK